MVLNIEIRGLNILKRFWARFDKNLVKEITGKQKEFMRGLQKSAKLRAPRWTGALAKSIVVRAMDKKTIVLRVESPYGAFQELGFKPHYVELRRGTRAGKVVADWAAAKGARAQTGAIFVSKFKPFIEPSIKANLPKLPRKLEIGARRAIKIS